MTRDDLKKLKQIKEQLDGDWEKFSPEEKEKVLKKLDVEHAYYSSTLEGNGLDKKRFEQLAEEIK